MIREKLTPMIDVLDVKVSVADKTASVQHKVALSPNEIVQILNDMHMGAALLDLGSAGSDKKWGWKDWLHASLWAIQVLCFVLGFTLQSQLDDPFWSSVVYGATIALSWPLFYKAWLAILRRKANVEFLMAAAMLGSLSQSQPMEAAMVGTIVTVMDAVTLASLQNVEKRLSSSITVPVNSVVLKDGKVIAASDLQVGMVFAVRAGDCILANGTVVSGDGAVNESRITGEAVPVNKATGCAVRGGSILQAGFLEIKCEAPVDKSFQNQILDAVKDAKLTQSDTELVVEQFAVWYTPTVIIVAAIVALVQDSFTQFLVIIVAGCPCAILGAAPMAQAAALAVLAKRHKFLVKNNSALEALASIQWLGIDKTGTLTSGRFALVNKKAVGEWSIENLHQWAAALEMKDNHPLAFSLVESYTGCVANFKDWGKMPRVTHFRREGRFGVTGLVDSLPIGVGNTDFLKYMDVPLEGEAARLHAEWSSQGTVLFITVDQDIGAVLLMRDALRPDALGTIDALRKLNVEPVMLTGDKGAAAQVAAEGANITKVHAGLLPEHKASILLQASLGKSEATDGSTMEAGLLETQRGKIAVGFIGDGLNDCLALAHANVGIVMQSVGPQATVDAASAVLQGELGQLPAAIVIARRTRRLVMANIILAVTMNIGVILAAAVVGLPLWLSVIADNASLLIVLANSLWPLCWNVKPVLA